MSSSIGPSFSDRIRGTGESWVWGFAQAESFVRLSSCFSADVRSAVYGRGSTHCSSLVVEVGDSADAGEDGSKPAVPANDAAVAAAAASADVSACA